MRSLRENCVLVVRVCSSRRLETNGAQERVDVCDDLLIQSMTSLLGETRVCGDRVEQAGSQRGVDALEEFQEDEADGIAPWTVGNRLAVEGPVRCDTDRGGHLEIHPQLPSQIACLKSRGTAE